MQSADCNYQGRVPAKQEFRQVNEATKIGVRVKYSVV